MWDYKIIKSDLWWNIRRKKEDHWMIRLDYLYGNGTWGTNKTLARTFYHKETALSALVVARHKDEWKESD